MNSCERVKAAFARREPDRVPVVEFTIDPKIVRQAVPEAIDAPDLCDRLDMDAVASGASFKKEALPDGTVTDEWGVFYKTGSEVVDHPIRGPIGSMEDLKAYRPLDPHAPHLLADFAKVVERYKGRRAVVFNHRAGFMWGAFLMGIDNLLLAFITDPRLAEAVLDLETEINEVIIRRAVRLGADAVLLGDDYASNIGPLFSPEHFRRFVFPRLRRIVAAIHEEGAYCIKHSDGNLWPILPQIVDTGIDALHPIDPLAQMTLSGVKRSYGDRICIIGNVDCSHLLSFGTADQVREAVRKCILEAGPGGGYMFSSSNSIHSSVKPENFLAMVKAAKEYGEYPIQNR